MTIFPKGWASISISDCICLDLDSGPLMPAALTAETAIRAKTKKVMAFMVIF